MAKFPFCDTKQENDWVYTPNQGALHCVPPVPLSRLAGYALAVRKPLSSQPPVIKYMHSISVRAAARCHVGEDSFQLEQGGPKPVLISATTSQFSP
jgi:hypothetical protein